MPYNNTAIAPPPEEQWQGHNSLPLMRIKKIIAADDDIGACSHNAAFVITIATEMFVWHLSEQAHNMSKAEGKPRRTIAYRDIANAVARLDNLEFLADVVPRTMTFKQYREKKAKTDAEAAHGVARGQKTLDHMRADRDGDVEMSGGHGHSQSHDMSNGVLRPITPNAASPPMPISPSSVRSAGRGFDAVRDAMEE